LIRVELGSQQDSEVHEKLRLCTDSDDRNDELFGRASLRRASSDVIKDVIVRCSEQVRFDRRRSDDINYPHNRRARTVPGDAPTAFAISRKLAPCSLNRAIWSPLTIRRGRPNVFLLSLTLQQIKSSWDERQTNDSRLDVDIAVSFRYRAAGRGICDFD